MGKRILSGAVVMVLAVAAILAGGTILAAVLFVISCTAYRELCKATGVHNKKGMDALETIGYGGIFLYYFLLWQKAAGYNLIGEKGIQFLLFMLPIGILMLMMAAYVLTFPKYRSEQVMAAFFCLFALFVPAEQARRQHQDAHRRELDQCQQGDHPVNPVARAGAVFVLIVVCHFDILPAFQITLLF